MSKFLYPIKNLNVESWIKYWLEKRANDFENKYVLSEILTGTSFYLTDSVNKKFNLFKITGNTTQESTTYIDTGTWEQGTIDSSNGNNIADSTSIRTADYIPVVPNILYNISRSIYSSYNVYRFYDSNKNYLGSHRTEGMITTNQDSNRMINGVSSMEMTIINTNVAYMRIADSSNDLNTVYTISTSAPNPSYPQDIKNTGDSGTINEKVQNKNLFDVTEFENNIVSGKILNNNGVEVTDTTSEYSTYKIPVKANETIHIKGWFQRIYLYDENKIFVNRSGSYDDSTISVQPSFNYTSTIDGYIGFQIYKSHYNANKGTELVEIGSTSTDYIAHAEQNISFPLSQGQKLMEGDYLADDGIHHVRGQVVFDGTESWIQDTASGNIYWYRKITGAISGTGIVDILSNYFKALFQNNTNGFYLANTNLIVFNHGIGTTVNDFKTWLSTHNTIVQYPLAEEVIDPYTEEQQTAWEQIKALRTYKPVTHITSEDETPANLEIQYWKEK